MVFLSSTYNRAKRVRILIGLFQILFSLKELMMSDSENNPLPTISSVVGGIVGITLMTMWITVVATFTHNWYTGG